MSVSPCTAFQLNFTKEHHISNSYEEIDGRKNSKSSPCLSEEENDHGSKQSMIDNDGKVMKPNNNFQKKHETKHKKEECCDSDSEIKSVKKSSKYINKKSTTNSHDEPEKKQKSLYKTELCRNWEETNHCRYGIKCQYAHGAADLREIDRHPKYKTQKCRTFHQTGSCPYGARCTFRHFNLPGDALEMKNLEQEEKPADKRQKAQNMKLLENWFLDSNHLLSGHEAKISFNNTFDPEDSLLPSNAESLLPHQLLFDLESPQEVQEQQQQQQPQQPARCPLRDYVNWSSFSKFQVPHQYLQQPQQQTFFRPWLF